VRVIAGTAQGTRLAAVPPGVRPVSDRAREGVFSSLGELVSGAAVLDLFAGTGAMGIEALSRGAAAAVFVERSPRAIASIRQNLERTRLADRARVVRSDVGRFLAGIGDVEGRFDLVLVDPPFDVGGSDLTVTLDLLAASAALGEGATVVLTRDSRSSIDVVPVNWPVAKRLRYGDSVLTLFRPRNLPRTTEV
jgi:16S rRNA (guanine966-N2)-methyltransferase